MNTLRDWAGSDDFGKFLLIIGGLFVVLIVLAARAAARLQEAREADQTIPTVMAAHGLVDAREIVSAGEPRTAPALTTDSHRSEDVEGRDPAGDARHGARDGATGHDGGRTLLESSHTEGGARPEPQAHQLGAPALAAARARYFEASAEQHRTDIEHYRDVCQRAFGDDPTPRSGPTVTHLAGGLPSAGDTSPSQPSTASS